MRMRCVTKNRAYKLQTLKVKTWGALALGICVLAGAGPAHAYNLASAPLGFTLSKTCLAFQSESTGSAPAVYTAAETASPAFVIGLRFAFDRGDHRALAAPHMALWSPGGSEALAMADSHACTN